MNVQRKLLVACAALSTVGLTAAALANEAPGSSRAHPLSAEQSLQADALGVAASLGISPEAAVSRLRVQQLAAPIAERVRTQYGDRLAGVYIEHAPRHRLVVRLVGEAPVRPEFHTIAGNTLEVAYVTGARHTLAELQQRFDEGFPPLAEVVSAVRSGYVDERTGQIVVELLRSQPGRALAGAAATQTRLAGLFDAPTRVVEVDEPLANQAVRGSARLDFTQSGTATFCTGGFTVRQPATSKYGLLTAGHCQSTGGSYLYTEAAGTSTYTLTHVARKFDADTDISFAMISTIPSDVTAEFRSSTGWRLQSGVRSKASTIVGMSICGWGTVGSEKCGTVSSTAYNPGSICGPGVTIGSGTSACNAAYVRLSAPSGSCVPGRSGGPMYVDRLAAGIHKAGNAAGTECIYTSIDDITASPLNLALVL